jgi:hypothetical protein
VYIREAHPADGWQVPQNVQDNLIINDPKTLPERQAVAREFAKQFQAKIPILVDPMDDPFNKAFAAWPDRIYVLDAAGKVVYKGGPGPRGFKVAEVPPVLQKLLGEKK